jgi:CHAD domain-containing protein
MRQYVRGQTRILLRRVASADGRAARTGDADAIHDLRVAIRRLRSCLRVFAEFYPRRSWKPIRRRLSDLMDACGRVRDRDIAIKLLGKAGLPTDSALLRQLDAERCAADGELRRQLRRWKEEGFVRRWTEKLEL